MVRLKLKSRLQASFLLLGFLSIGVTGWQAYVSASQALEEVTLARLISIRESRKLQVETYFRNKRDQLVTISEYAFINESADAFMRAFHDVNRMNERLVSSAPADVRPDTAARLLQSVLVYRKQANGPDLAEWLTAYRNYGDRLRHCANRFGFDQMYIIDAATGDIVYSLQPGADLGIRIDTAGTDRSVLASAFLEAVKAEAGDVHMTDFAHYAPAGTKPVAFLSIPIFSAGIRTAVLAVRITTDEINAIMTERSNWENSGLGKSGETYLVGPDFKMRSDARFFLEQPGTYETMLSKKGIPPDRIDQLHRSSSTILVQDVHTRAANEALMGGMGTAAIDDYRGVPVASSWTPVNVPDNRWVLIAEIDIREAFSSVYALRERLIQTGLIILLCATVLGFLISRTIVKPVMLLSSIAEQFGRGNLDRRINMKAHDEIGELAATLNTMADNLKNRTVQLEGEIAERLNAEKRLKESRQQLRNLSSHLQSIREEERKRIAREIHDELGQVLTALKLNLSLLRQGIPDGEDEVYGQIGAMFELIDSSIQSVKRIITELRPGLLDDLGLLAAIEWQAEEFQRRTGIDTHVKYDAIGAEPGTDIAVGLFRILQETLTNVTRHARASVVEIYLHIGESVLELVVRDNGRGITLNERDDPHSFGIIGIRERAIWMGGKAIIEGSANAGTKVTVRIPIDSQDIKS
jgi:signal transduction histidine kinase